MKDYNLSYDVLKSQIEVEEKEILPSKTIEVQKPKTKKKRYNISAEHILYLMMNNLKYVQKYKNELGFFQDAEYRGIANEILYYCEKHGQIIFADFLSYAETSPLKEQIYKIIQGINEEDIDDNSMDEYIYIIDPTNI